MTLGEGRDGRGRRGGEEGAEAEGTEREGEGEGEGKGEGDL